MISKMNTLCDRIPKVVLFAFSVTLLFMVVELPGEESDAIQMLKHEKNDTISITINNTRGIHYWVYVDVNSNNISSNFSFPMKWLAPPYSRDLSFSLWPTDSTKSYRYSLNYKWKKAEDSSTTCQDDVFCIITEQLIDSLVYLVDNQQSLPISIRFTPRRFENLQSTVIFPLVTWVRGKSRAKLFAAKIIDVWEERKNTYTYKWHYGIVNARHDDQYVYALPFKRGTTHRVGQGFLGEFSHHDTYAVDWNMPIGTGVHAARDGFVITAVDSFREGGVDAKLTTNSNIIEILHVDGTIGIYAHLRYQGALVEEGDLVRRGRHIGRSGNTGYSTGPHLHFEVARLDGQLDLQSIPVRFQIDEHRVGIVKEGESYTATR